MLLSLDSKSISVLRAIFNVFCTLLSIDNRSLIVAGIVNPGKVPIAYCIFSASALMTCPRLSSSMAIDANNKFNASSLDNVIVGVMFGRFACDIFNHLPLRLYYLS